jgi:GNAT superfamily N-acetyltransferase
MAGVDIARAAPGDATTLTAIARASKADWGYEPAMLRVWDPQLTVSADLIRLQPVWSAVIDGVIIGFYALGPGEEDWEIEHLWVHPEWMGRGVGQALFEHAAAEARSAGARVLRVVSDPHAEGFYRRMGARRVGEQDSVPEGRRLPVLLLNLET